jgi:hypothetical protein
VQSELASSWNEYADKIARGGDSILAQLSRYNFECGLRNLREYAAHADSEGERVTELVDYFVYRRD